jgi:DNA-directed RNA polymerase specialized sigma24 family protein
MASERLGREELNLLMTQIRPRLHRYCARMVGSVFDGEGIVQEALAKAAEALPSAGTIEKAERRTIASRARLAQQLAPGRNEREPEEHPGEREEPGRLACCCRDRRDQS